jgi:hypothetical protein
MSSFGGNLMSLQDMFIPLQLTDRWQGSILASALWHSSGSIACIIAEIASDWTVQPITIAFGDIMRDAAFVEEEMFQSNVADGQRFTKSDSDSIVFPM